MIDLKNKKTHSVITVYAIILVFYVLAFFVIPFEKGAVAWISFAFTVVSVLISGAVCGSAFGRNETMVSKIYGFPVFRVGALYSLIQLGLGVVFCIIASFVDIYLWIPVLFYAALFCTAFVGIIATDNARDIIEELDQKLKDDTANNQMFRLSLSVIANECEDSVVKNELVKLEEKFRFSDPVSSPATLAIEESIKIMVNDLRSKINELPKEESLAMIKKISDRLEERNQICVMNK